MKVILLTDVQKVGRKYEVKDVSPGFAQNSLIPSRKAELATKAKLASLETLVKKAQEEQKVRENLLQKNLGALKDVKVTIQSKANDKGHLFQAVHENQIVVVLKEQAHIDLDSNMIVIGEPIKAVGEHDVHVTVGEEQSIFKLAVEPE